MLYTCLYSSFKNKAWHKLAYTDGYFNVFTWGGIFLKTIIFKIKDKWGHVKKKFKKYFIEAV